MTFVSHIFKAINRNFSISMNRFMFYAAAACAALVVCTSCDAYECRDAESYRNGLQELELAHQVNAARLGIAVKFIQKTKGADFDAALRQVMQTATPEQTKPYDDLLARIGAQIKTARHDSPETCDALLLLQRQYAAAGAQKLDFITRLVTGKNSEPDPPEVTGK